MALNDIIDNIDYALYDFTEKISDKLEGLTKLNRNKLIVGFYAGGSLAWGIGAYLINKMDDPLVSTGSQYFILGSAILGCFAVSQAVRPSTREVTIIGNLIKYVDVALYGVGIYITISGVANLYEGFSTGDFYDTIHDLTGGLGVLGMSIGNYLRRKKPKKPERKKEKAKNPVVVGS